MPELQASDFKNLGKIILSTFENAQKSIKLYPSGHPKIRKALEDLMEALAVIFKSLDRINLNIIRNELYLNDTPLKAESMRYTKFIRQCIKRNVSSITILAEIGPEELEKFLNILSQDAEQIIKMGGVKKLLLSENIESITVARILPYISTTAGEESEDIDEEVTEFQGLSGKEAYNAAVEAFKSVCSQIDNKYISMKTVKATIQSLIENVLHNKQVMAELLNLKHQDDYTFHHSVNVALISVLIGAALRFGRKELNLLGEVAILHDIGKLLVPLEIINKPGKLNDEEWEQMKLHPVNGARVLAEVKEVNDLCIIGAFEHHSRYDLKGYPTIKEKKEPHLFSQIIAIADTYDAVTSDRAYRKAFLADDAFKIILKSSSDSLNPNLVKLFLNLIGCYPVGCLVELDSGEIGLVQEVNRFSLLRPKVKILINEEGSSAKEEIVDLTELNPATDEPRRSVVRALDPYKYNIDIAEYL